MNILPKKKWHVRTKENMARVRRDEAKAEEEERQRLDRAILAENERRLQALRSKADDRMTTMFGKGGERQSQEDMSISSETGHVNFFQDLEREERKNHGEGNKEYEKEKKKEQQEWESKMGIQKMLGEGTNELDKKKEWYENLPGLRTAPKPIKYGAPMPHAIVKDGDEDSDDKKKHKKKKKKESSKHKKDRKHRRKRSSSNSSSDSESESSSKHKKKKKKRKRKHSKSEVEEEEKRRKYLAEKHSHLAMLREERIRRERQEKGRTELLLNPELAAKKEEPTTKKPKYNSQFNPELSRY